MMISAQEWVERLSNSLDVARTSDDVEGPHQIRVAIMHLRVFLDLAKDSMAPREQRDLDRRLRLLRDEVGVVRDLDVAAVNEERGGGGGGEEWRRQAAHRRLRLKLARDARASEIAHLLAQLRRLPSISRRRASRLLPALAHRTLKRGRQIEKRHDEKKTKKKTKVKQQQRQQQRALDDLHRLRRMVRRLRFALEWIHHEEQKEDTAAASDAKDLARLQDSLGRLCDLRLASHLASKHDIAHAAERALAHYKLTKALIEKYED